MGRDELGVKSTDFFSGRNWFVGVWQEDCSSNEL